MMSNRRSILAVGLVATIALVWFVVSADDTVARSGSPSGNRLGTLRLDGPDQVPQVTVEELTPTKWYGGPGFDGRQMKVSEVFRYRVVMDGATYRVMIASLDEPESAERLLVGLSVIGSVHLDPGLWEGAYACPGASCWSYYRGVYLRVGSVCYAISRSGLPDSDDPALVNEGRDGIVKLATLLARRQANLQLSDQSSEDLWESSKIGRDDLPADYRAIMAEDEERGGLSRRSIARVSWSQGLVAVPASAEDPGYLETLVSADPQTLFSVVYRRFDSEDAARRGADQLRSTLDSGLEPVLPTAGWSQTAARYLGTDQRLCPGQSCLAVWHPPTLSFVVQDGDWAALIVTSQRDNRSAVEQTLAVAQAFVDRRLRLEGTTLAPIRQ